MAASRCWWVALFFAGTRTDGAGQAQGDVQVTAAASEAELETTAAGGALLHPRGRPAWR